MLKRDVLKNQIKFKNEITDLKNNKANANHSHASTEISFDNSKYETNSTLHNKNNVQEALESIGDAVDTLSSGGGTVAWSGISNKPFTNLGSTMDAIGGSLNVKLDNNTITKDSNGSLKVVDNKYSEKTHNHDNSYTPISHANDNDIHVTLGDKTSINKIPSLESAIAIINASLGATTKQHIKKTLDEMKLIDANHGDICHVIDESTTYIYDKDNINQTGEHSEWIKVSDFNSLTSVDWSIINNKPFNTIGNGLINNGGSLDINIDTSNMVLSGGKIKVKDNIYASINHNHSFKNLTEKPYFNTTIDSFILSDGLYYKDIRHGLKTKNIILSGYNSLNEEVMVFCDTTDIDNARIWTDVNERLRIVLWGCD